MQGWERLPPDRLDPDDFYDLVEKDLDTVLEEIVVAEKLAELYYKIDSMEIELEEARLNQAARQETRKYALRLYTLVVLFTMGMYVSEGLGYTQLGEGLLWGLAGLTIGEAIGLVTIVFRYVFPQGASRRNEADSIQRVGVEISEELRRAIGESSQAKPDE